MRLTLVIGPTGIGKSDYAISLAKQTGAQIISADAYQVYRGMDIGTAKVSAELQRSVRHHLIDILDPNEPYSVHEFLSRTNTLIQSTSSPYIICGGTGLYTHALLHDFSLTAPSNPTIRAELTDTYAIDNGATLHVQLTQRDPQSATTIHPNNKHRLIRALEIAMITNEKPSELKQRSTQRTDIAIIGLTSSRDTIRDRIDRRVDAMMAQGFRDEVQHLCNRYPTIPPALHAIGYKQLSDHLIQNTPLDEAVEQIKIKTKQFAKRQLTWYRRLNHVKWIDIS